MSTEPCGTEWDDPVTDDAHMCKVIGEHDLHECQCGTVQFTTPPGPRVWSLPAEPGPEVTAVRDSLGVRWALVYAPPVSAWAPEYDPMMAFPWPWHRLISERAPLTDATGEPA